MVAATAIVGLVSSLANVALAHYKTKPNYDQKVYQTARENLAEYIYEKEAEHGDNRRIDELETWLTVFAKDLI